METLFENRYVRDEETVKEVNRYLHFAQPIQIVVYVLMAASVMSVAYGFLNGLYMQAALYFLFLALFLVLKLFLYRRAVKTQLARDREMNGGPVEIRESVTAENIQSVTARETVPIVLEFDQIRNVRQTKNLILIFTKARLIHIFVKDRFLKGTPEDFLAFLKQKGVRV